ALARGEVLPDRFGDDEDATVMKDDETAPDRRDRMHADSRERLHEIECDVIEYAREQPDELDLKSPAGVAESIHGDRHGPRGNTRRQPSREAAPAEQSHLLADVVLHGASCSTCTDELTRAEARANGRGVSEACGSCEIRGDSSSCSFPADD